ncbi:hypothetical protein DNTS_033397 [Danionella cerebrum]|uniref:Uncharacterized protein n=1 Tax=Danionella cerebrum TaxID=2873325 RepID=A0A553MMX2_9TELE|nr:hypothetical protein DNTS_033397 [Danionella translucida]
MHSLHLLCLAALCFCKLIPGRPIQENVGDTLREMEAKVSSYGFNLLKTIRNNLQKAVYQEAKGGLLLKKRNDCHRIPKIICLDTTKKQRFSSNDVVLIEPLPFPHSNKPNSLLRQRRSQHLDPADPLGSEQPRSRSISYRKTNGDNNKGSGNVSRETITSCDDPLHVLLQKSPVSPHLEKKKYKHLAPSDPF